MFVNQKRPLHRHLSAFVEWIATEEAREESIREQANDIRERIKAKANADGLTIRSMPWSGSFKKRTGLRRHMLGLHPVEGQDVDLPFVISPRTLDDQELNSLINRFYKYAHSTYPNTTKRTTKSSVKLEFTGTKLSYDLVPMLAGADDETQIIIRSDGERHPTSVQKHIAFITSRTQRSNELPGRVKFNECVRLLKWWREVVTGGDVDQFPSIVVDLLCAHAFDRVQVERTYPDTLLRWFGLLADAAEARRAIYFADYTAWSAAPTFKPWSIIDPVNHKNNVASRFKGVDVDAIAGWFADARDAIAQAIAHDQDDDEVEALNALVPVFGNPILNHNGG